MRRVRSFCAFFAMLAALVFAAAGPALAVQPDEVLADPALETRARDISAGLRCLVCQNQSIDDSEAQIARDLRVLVRDRLEAGESDDEVVDYIVSRYGQFVLLRPSFTPATVLLWSTPLIVLLLGFAGIRAWRRRREEELADEGGELPLTPEEERRLKRVIARGEATS